MAKASYPDIDKLFEKMDRKTANKMNGTHPPRKGGKKPKKKAKK